MNKKPDLDLDLYGLWSVGICGFLALFLCTVKQFFFGLQIQSIMNTNLIKILPWHCKVNQYTVFKIDFRQIFQILGGKLSNLQKSPLKCEKTFLFCLYTEIMFMVRVRSVTGEKKIRILQIRPNPDLQLSGHEISVLDPD